MLLKKVKELYQKYPFLVIGLCVFLVLLLTTNYSQEVYQKRYSNCLGYVEQGTLYQGQLYCPAGPLVFYIPYYLKELFGDYYSAAMYFVLILVHVVGFVVLYKMVYAETKKFPNLILFTVLYGVFIYSLSITSAERVLDADLSYLFLLLGVYILFYTQLKYKGIFGMVSMLISLLNKFTSFLGVLLFTVGYFLSLDCRKIKISFDFKKLKELLPGLGLVVVVLILLKLRFPYIFIYAVQMHMTSFQPHLQSYATVVKELITFSPYINLLYLFYLAQVFLIYFVVVKKECKLYLFYAILGWWAVLISRLRYHSDWYGIVSVYSMSIMPFVILSFFYLKNKYFDALKKHLLRFLFRTFVSLFIIFTVFYFLVPHYSGVLFSDLETEKQQLQNAVFSGVRFIDPPENKKIIIESPFENYTKDKLIRANPTFAQASFIEILPHNETNVIMEMADSYVLLKLLGQHAQKPEEEKVASPLINDIVREIQQNEVGMIVLSPPQWAVVRKIVNDSHVKAILDRDYCYVAYPDFELVARDGVAISGFFIQKNNSSGSFSSCVINETVAWHYQDLGASLCSKSQVAVSKINTFLKYYGFKPIICKIPDKTSRDFVDRYAQRTTVKYEVILFVAVVFVNLLFLFVRRT